MTWVERDKCGAAHATATCGSGSGDERGTNARRSLVLEPLYYDQPILPRLPGIDATRDELVL